MLTLPTMIRSLAAAVALTLATHAAPLPLIPLPVEIETGEGSFPVTADTAIHHDRALAGEARLLAADLAKLTRPARAQAGAEGGGR